MVLTFNAENTYIYLCLFLISLFILIKYKQEFEKESLIKYLIYLTNKVLLFFSFITFLFLFCFALLDIAQSKLDFFLKEVFVIFFFYGFINYGILFSVTTIYYFIDLFKKNDLFSFSLINTKELKK